MTHVDIEEVKRLLSRDVLKENLARASVYLLAYEMLEDAIIEQPKSFFTAGRPRPHTDYEEKVLSRHESRLIASCMWFRDFGVLRDLDIAAVREIRQHRTDIAHEMPNVLLNLTTQVDVPKLMQMYTIIGKIDCWWIAEVEIPCNPDFDGEEIDYTGIKSARMMFLEYLISAVFDNAPTP